MRETNTQYIPTALSIAGSDPSGGAGIQADLKTFSAHQVYGMSVITALTAQNTTGVNAIHLVPAEFVATQINTIFKDIRVDAIKIGMIATAEIAIAIADALEKKCDSPIVLDTIMIAKGGHSLLANNAVTALKTRLLPLATLITPNLPEAAHLLETDIAQTRQEIEIQGRALLKLGAKAILMKGGHLAGEESPDLLISESEAIWLEGKRINTKNTHGTGCTLSAAIAAELAKGNNLKDAVSSAKAYLRGAISAADTLNIGSGHGPTHHFYQYWR
ncbi:MAG TPA: bifunctional hydroxymethylpyrimidine kinase/phosphomethylpyrimidine kinase [Leucothrix mucor]|nr:bifunctional hydroxymethylpyrimidine kinase/phosphomethylpyrimidine kinase [Leucothrix mucor]